MNSLKYGLSGVVNANKGIAQQSGAILNTSGKPIWNDSMFDAFEEKFKERYGVDFELVIKAIKSQHEELMV